MDLLEKPDQEGEGLNGSLREQQGLGKFCLYWWFFFFFFLVKKTSMFIGVREGGLLYLQLRLYLGVLNMWNAVMASIQ